MADERVTAAFEQGARGRRQALRLEQNPYNPAPGSLSEKLHLAWRSGWKQQEASSIRG